eukprot:364426-Chlamydomonas_euryale.AAC.12
MHVACASSQLVHAHDVLFWCAALHAGLSSPAAHSLTRFIVHAGSEDPCVRDLQCIQFAAPCQHLTYIAR